MLKGTGKNPTMVSNPNVKLYVRAQFQYSRILPLRDNIYNLQDEVLSLSIPLEDPCRQTYHMCCSSEMFLLPLVQERRIKGQMTNIRIGKTAS